MKKILIGAPLIALLASAASYIYRDEIRMMMAFNELKPAAPFRHASSPASPDYSREESWAALPDCVDSADALAEIGVMDQQASAAVDVFFIHPTTYFGTTTGISRWTTHA